MCCTGFSSENHSCSLDSYLYPFFFSAVVLLAFDYNFFYLFSFSIKNPANRPGFASSKLYAQRNHLTYNTLNAQTKYNNEIYGIIYLYFCNNIICAHNLGIQERRKKTYTYTNDDDDDGV